MWEEGPLVIAGCLSEIGEMVSLKSLLLGHNLLKALPESIARCSALSTLELQNNQLHRLPEQLGNCGSLRLLNAAENRLEYLPPMVSCYGFSLPKTSW